MNKSIWLRRLQAGFTGLVVGSLISVLYRLWPQVRLVLLEVDGKLLALAILIVVITNLLWALCWSWLLRRMDQSNQSLVSITSAFIYGNMAKYIPGSVWNYFARAYLGGQSGVRTRRIWIANYLEFIGLITVGGVIYLLSLFWPHIHPPLVDFSILGAGIVLSMLFVSPPFLKFIDHQIKKRLHQSEDSTAINLSLSLYLVFYLVAGLIWILVGVGFFLVINSISPTPATYIYEAVGILAIAFVIGMLAVGFPQGIGVREGIVVWALGFIMPIPTAFTIALLARLWLIISEVVSLGVWWLITRILFYKKHFSVDKASSDLNLPEG